MHKLFITIMVLSLLILATWFGIRLYNVTSQPGLTMKDNIYTVVNCESPRDEHANMACPYLYCNKALLESGQIPINAKISRSHNKNADNKNNINGVIRYSNEKNMTQQHSFQCQMQNDTVIDYKTLPIK